MAASTAEIGPGSAACTASTRSLSASRMQNAPGVSTDAPSSGSGSTRQANLARYAQVMLGKLPQISP